MRIPPEPPIFSKRGRAANAARCKRDALTGYEGASPSASTMHPTRRKRRTVLVRQRAGRTSRWRLHCFADVAELGDAAARGAVGREPNRGATPLVRTSFFAAWLECRHGGLKPRWASLPVPVRLRPPRPFCGRAWNRRPGGLKNRCALRRVSVQLAPAAPTVFRRVVERIHTSLRNSRAKAHAGASPVSPTNLSWPRRTKVVRQPLKLDIGARFSAWLPLSPRSSK